MSERKTWVLDTDTKGTGARMVPLESIEHKNEPRKTKVWVPRKRRPRDVEPPAPRPPRRFRVVDLLSRQVLQEDAGVAETLALLDSQSSELDVSVSVWEPDEERWRLLSLAERRAVWERRHR